MLFLLIVLYLHYCRKILRKRYQMFIMDFSGISFVLKVMMKIRNGSRFFLKCI